MRVNSPADKQRSQRSSGSCEEEGYGHLPVCIAKTQYSFSSDPEAPGSPDPNFDLTGT